MRASVAAAGLLAALGMAGSPPAEGSTAARVAMCTEDRAAVVDETDALSAGAGPHGAAPEGGERDVGGSGTGPSRAAGVLHEGIDTEAVPGVNIRLYWKRGINYRVENEIVLFEHASRLDGRIGMRMQVDAAAYAPAGGTGVGGGIDLRRFYFYTTGELDFIYPILFSVDLGVQGDGFFVDDAYLWLTDLPYVGTLKIGQFDAPMSLAQLTGSGTRPLMETGTPAEAFAPASKAGIQLANDAYDRRLTWQVGWFGDTQAVAVGDASESFARVVGRLTGLPVFERGADGPRLLHLGISSSFVFASRQRVRYRSRPESFLAPDLVDTGDIDASGAALLGLEAAWVDGPVSFQAELLGSSVRSRDRGNPVLFGVYAMGSYFLTGESRPFNRKSAIFAPVVPTRPFHWENGQTGAWELAGRLSYTDLSDDGVDGGEVITLLTGINWYWSRYGRLMFEYGYSNARGGPKDGGLHIFQTRFQVNI